MKITEVLKHVMTIKEVRPSVLASRLGLKPNAMSNRLSRDEMATTNLVATLKAMDYKLVAVPRETRVPEGSFEVE